MKITQRIGALSCLLGLLIAGCSRSSPQISPGIGQSLPWEQMRLAGRLVFIQSNGVTNQLNELDFKTRKTTTLFALPDRAWLAAESVSPDGKQIVLAYSPPPPGNKPQFGYTDLYIMSYGVSGQLKPLLTRSGEDESFFNPTWSPDGNYIYYAHLYRANTRVPSYKYRVERIQPGGQPEALIEDALWPCLSPDGTWLAYLTFSSASNGNELYLAGPDGKNPEPVLPPGRYPAVDAHFFLPDGKTVIFSAVNTLRAPARNWLERLLGVRIASAHTTPSDWYGVSLADRQVQRLTRLGDTGMYGALAPDGRHIAFISQTGLYVMEPNGANLTSISTLTLVGTIDWLP